MSGVFVKTGSAGLIELIGEIELTCAACGCPRNCPASPLLTINFAELFAGR
jgi:hypothetical protein